MKGCRPLKFYGVGGNVVKSLHCNLRKKTRHATLQYPPSFKRQNLSIFYNEIRLKIKWSIFRL